MLGDTKRVYKLLPTSVMANTCVNAFLHAKSADALEVFTCRQADMVKVEWGSLYLGWEG